MKYLNIKPPIIENQPNTRERSSRFTGLGMIGRIIFILFIPYTLWAQSLTIPMYSTDASQTPLGEVTVEDTPFGLLITPHLEQLPPGIHGFHVHEHPSCHDGGMAAQGHLDPQKTNSHQGPYKTGHLGDLPVLHVNGQGRAELPTLAPRLKIADITGHTFMIHAGGDTYSNIPPSGGGGNRLACGVIP